MTLYLRSQPSKNASLFFNKVTGLRPATLLKKRPWHGSVIMNSSLPSSKTQAQWQGVYGWLQFTSEKKIVCKVCCWCAHNSGVGFTRKFLMGSTNYQLSAIKYHNASCPHDEAVKVKEYTIAKKAGVSLHPPKLVHKTSTDSAIMRGFLRINDKDHNIVTKLHDVSFYIALHGLPFTMSEHQINLEKLYMALTISVHMKTKLPAKTS